LSHRSCDHHQDKTTTHPLVIRPAAWLACLTSSIDRLTGSVRRAA
jgi:hypothetical protein